MKAIRRAVTSALFAVGCLLVGAAAPLPVTAAHLSLFRIGTGGIGGTYYPIASLVAQIISNPAGRCERGESCGVPGLVAVAQSSSGSVANVKDIAAGRIERSAVLSRHRPDPAGRSRGRRAGLSRGLFV